MRDLVIFVRYGLVLSGITFFVWQQTPPGEAQVSSNESNFRVAKQQNVKRRRFVSCSLGVPRAGLARRTVIPGRSFLYPRASNIMVDGGQGLIYEGKEGYVPFANLGMGHSPQLFIKLGSNGGIVDAYGRPYRTPSVLARP